MKKWNFIKRWVGGMILFCAVIGLWQMVSCQDAAAQTIQDKDKLAA